MSHSTENSITKIRIYNSLMQNLVSPEEMPKQLGVHRAAVYRWIKKIKLKGINKFIRDYSKAKKGRKQPRKTDPLTKIRVFKIRKDYHNCCGRATGNTH